MLLLVRFLFKLLNVRCLIVLINMVLFFSGGLGRDIWILKLNFCGGFGDRSLYYLC